MAENDLLDWNKISNDSSKKFLSYNELMQRHKEKIAEQKDKESKIKEFADLESIMTTKPSKELATLEHYSSIPGVGVSPDVNLVLNDYQNNLDEQKEIANNSTKDFMSAFEALQNYEESLDAKNRDSMGVNSLKNQEKEAKKRIKQLQYELNPFEVMLGIATGEKKGLHTIEDAVKNLRRIQEQKKSLQQSKDMLLVKQYECHVKMTDAKEKIATSRYKALQISKEMEEKVQPKLAPQYAIIDKYLAIQKLKNSENYPSIYKILKARDPQLANDLENFPNSLSENTLVISLENPLELSNIPIDETKINEVNEKINEIKGKLPQEFNIDMNDISSEIKNRSLSEDDTIESLEQQMSQADITPDEYKTLEMKKNHLELKEKIENTTPKNIEDLKEKNNETSEKIHSNYEKLNTKQQNAKLLKNEIDKYSLSRNDTVQSLEQQMSRVDRSSDEYKILEMKKNHLEIQEEIVATQKSIVELDNTINSPVDLSNKDDLKLQKENLEAKLETLKQKAEKDSYSTKVSGLKTKYDDTQKSITELKENIDTDTKYLQVILSDLKKEQDNLELLKEEYKNDEYSTTITNLQELEKLVDEKMKLEKPSQLRNTTTITSRLEGCNLIAQTGPISNIFIAIRDTIQKQKENNIKKIEQKTNPQLINDKSNDTRDDENNGR